MSNTTNHFCGLGQYFTFLVQVLVSPRCSPEKRSRVGKCWPVGDEDNVEAVRLLSANDESGVSWYPRPLGGSRK